MLGIVKDLVEGGSEAIRAEAEAAGERAKGALLGLAAQALCVLLVLLGLGLALGGLTIHLASLWGWPEALSVVGGTLAVVGAVVWAVVNHRLSSREAKTQKDEQHSAATTPQPGAAQPAGTSAGSSPNPESHKPQGTIADTFERLKDKAVEQALNHPVAVGTGALLVAAALGPTRSIRLVSRALATAGIAATVIDAIAQLTPKSSKPPRTPGPGQAPPTHPNHPPDRRGPAGHQPYSNNHRSTDPIPTARAAQPRARGRHNIPTWDEPFQF